MKQYRVKTSSFHSDHTQKVYNGGDIIPEDSIHPDALQKSIDEGWIEEYKGKKNEHSASTGTPHVVTAADVERNPNAGFTEGETIYLPFDGFILDDTANQAQNDDGLASHDEGKVLVTADQAKAPLAMPPSDQTYETPITDPGNPESTDAPQVAPPAKSKKK